MGEGGVEGVWVGGVREGGREKGREGAGAIVVMAVLARLRLLPLR